MFGRILMVAVLIVSLTGVASAALQLGIPETIQYGVGGVAPNNLGITPAVQDISSNMTIAFWFKAAAGQSGTWNRVMGSLAHFSFATYPAQVTGFEINFVSDPVNHSLALALSTQGVAGGPGGVNQCMGIAGAADGELHHVAWVITDDVSPLGAGNGTVYKYLDGVLLTEEQDFYAGAQSYIQGVGFSENLGQPLVIGATSYNPGYLQASFEMGDLRIYDNVLSAGDIANLVPEPMTMSLMAIGGIALLRRRR